jgi:hypothetical protein
MNGVYIHIILTIMTPREKKKDVVSHRLMLTLSLAFLFYVFSLSFCVPDLVGGMTHLIIQAGWGSMPIPADGIDSKLWAQESPTMHFASI